MATYYVNEQMLGEGATKAITQEVVRLLRSRGHEQVEYGEAINNEQDKPGQADWDECFELAAINSEDDDWDAEDGYPGSGGQSPADEAELNLNVIDSGEKLFALYSDDTAQASCLAMASRVQAGGYLIEHFDLDLIEKKPIKSETYADQATLTDAMNKLGSPFEWDLYEGDD